MVDRKVIFLGVGGLLVGGIATYVLAQRARAGGIGAVASSPVTTVSPIPSPVSASPSASVPAAPTGVTVTGISTSAVRVSWQPVPGAIGYQVIHPAWQSTPEKVVATVSGTSAEISGLAWSSPYSVQVRAWNSAGWGPRSVMASGSTLR